MCDCNENLEKRVTSADADEKLLTNMLVGNETDLKIDGESWVALFSIS